MTVTSQTPPGPRTQRVIRELGTRKLVLEDASRELDSLPESIDLAEERDLIAQFSGILAEIEEAIAKGRIEWAEDEVERFPLEFDVKDCAFMKQRLRETLQWERLPRLLAAICMIESQLETLQGDLVSPGELQKIEDIKRASESAQSDLAAGIRRATLENVRAALGDADEVSRILHRRSELLESPQKIESLVGCAFVEFETVTPETLKDENLLTAELVIARFAELWPEKVSLADGELRLRSA